MTLFFMTSKEHLFSVAMSSLSDTVMTELKRNTFWCSQNVSSGRDGYLYECGYDEKLITTLCVRACVTMHNVLPMTCERAAVAEAFTAVMELTRVWAFTRMGA